MPLEAMRAFMNFGHCVAVSALYMVKKYNLLFSMIISFAHDLYM